MDRKDKLQALDSKHACPWRAVCWIIGSIDLGFTICLAVLLILTGIEPLEIGILAIVVVSISFPFALVLIWGAVYDCKGAYIPYVVWKPFHVCFMVALSVLSAMEASDEKEDQKIIWMVVMALVRGIISLYYMFTFVWVLLALVFQRSPFCIMTGEIGATHPEYVVAGVDGPKEPLDATAETASVESPEFHLVPSGLSKYQEEYRFPVLVGPQE
ncbi:unnamed protein product [Cyprideis torosa]|uniref:Uncharacterized protein n=1 Tax=Cyprideis torosa TaxID=163714 RepID=A0A7R8WAR9_9CRUS|nr:unnamed protein product [Cyprideis torosa]CAG0891373.1 unnamed protein product [Cyprideis torosa]